MGEPPIEDLGKVRESDPNLYSLKSPIGHDINPVDLIVKELKEKHGLDVPDVNATKRLATQLHRIEIRRAIWESYETIPDLNPVREKLSLIENLLRKLSEFATSDDAVFIHVRRIIKDQDTFNELGDYNPIGPWLDRSVEIHSVTKEASDKLIEAINKSEKPKEDWQDSNVSDSFASMLIDHNSEDGPSRKYKTVLMGELLPKLFQSIYPKVAFGTQLPGEIPQGPGYSFVCMAMTLLGYGEVTAWAIQKYSHRSNLAKKTTT